jgi:hypothetical protein
MKSLNKAFSLIGAGALALAALPASANSLDAIQFSDILKIYAGGQLIDQRAVLEGAELPGEVYYMNNVSRPLGNPSQFGNPTVLLEADGSISDIFGVVQISSGSYAIGFMSDENLDLGVAAQLFGFNPAGANLISFLEVGGQVYDATMYLNLETHQGYTATFQSDGDERQVPDGGSTLFLLGLAMAGCSTVRRWIK